MTTPSSTQTDDVQVPRLNGTELRSVADVETALSHYNEDYNDGMLGRDGDGTLLVYARSRVFRHTERLMQAVAHPESTVWVSIIAHRVRDFGGETDVGFNNETDDSGQTYTYIELQDRDPVTGDLME